MTVRSGETRGGGWNRFSCSDDAAAGSNSTSTRSLLDLPPKILRQIIETSFYGDADTDKLEESSRWQDLWTRGLPTSRFLQTCRTVYAVGLPFLWSQLDVWAFSLDRIEKAVYGPTRTDKKSFIKTVKLRYYLTFTDSEPTLAMLGKCLEHATTFDMIAGCPEDCFHKIWKLLEKAPLLGEIGISLRESNFKDIDDSRIFPPSARRLLLGINPDDLDAKPRNFLQLLNDRAPNLEEVHLHFGYFWGPHEAADFPMLLSKIASVESMPTSSGTSTLVPSKTRRRLVRPWTCYSGFVAGNSSRPWMSDG